jgi:hypothetical protein
MHPFIISIFIFVIALPCATFILFRILGRIAFQDLVLLSSTIGPLFVTYSVFVLGYTGLLSRHNLLLISVAIFVIPLLTRDVRSIILSTFRVRVRVFHKNIKNHVNNLSTLDAFMLSLVISLIILTIPSAFTLPPVLRDPYAVWLFYGKKIAETSIIPLFMVMLPIFPGAGIIHR